jgi:hypothetical protein
MKFTLGKTEALFNFVRDLHRIPILNFLIEGYCNILLTGKKAREWHYEKAELMAENDDVDKLI